MATPITGKITEYSIVNTDEAAKFTSALKENDECPLIKRIERRPEGALPAITEKIRYNTQEGTKKLYLIVSFMQVEGVVDGERVSIERPIEFFIPSNQMSSEQQWMTSSLRMLSLNARGGYVAQALYDMRKVSWDKGPVRCGRNEWGKPIMHDSEVAAIGWAIQQILHKQGFLTSTGKQVSVEELIKANKHLEGVDTEAVDDYEESTSTQTVDEADPVVENCPECGNGMKLRSGCPTCVEGCGYSKCG